MLQIDWQQPWFAAWARHGEQVLHAWQHQPLDLPSALNQSLLIDSNHPTSTRPLNSPQRQWRFVQQHALAEGCAYEAYIFQQGQIPTRNNAHDFFNGLCWLRFPKTKAQLNRLQAQAIAKDGVGAQRGALRDALTLFDENAVLLCAPPSLWQALQAKQWHALFVTQREQWRDAQLVLFGHALLEKLMQPYKGMTAHVLCMPMPQLKNDEDIDAWLCQQLTPDYLTSKPFTPLPLAGVPGWWPGNEVPAFFEDKKVFRD